MKFTNIYGKTYSNEFKLFEYTLCVDRDKIPTYVHHHRHSAVWLGPTLCGHWVVKDVSIRPPKMFLDQITFLVYVAVKIGHIDIQC